VDDPPPAQRPKSNNAAGYLTSALLFWILFALADGVNGSAEIWGGNGAFAHAAFWGVFGGIVGLPVCTILIWVVFETIGWFLRRPVPMKYPAAIALCLGLIAIGQSVWGFVPSHRFAAEVLNPMPASVQNITIGRTTSFSDGGAWYFGFDISPADFATLCQRRGLVEKPVDWKTYADDVQWNREHGTPDNSFPFEGEQALSSWVGYHRVSNARVFVGQRILAVTDPGTTHVQLMVDHWRYP